MEGNDHIFKDCRNAKKAWGYIDPHMEIGDTKLLLWFDKNLKSNAIHQASNSS